MDVAQRCGSIRRQRRRRTVRGKLSQPLLAALNPGWIPPDAPPRGEEWALHQIRLALQDGEIPVRWAQLRWPATTTFIPGTLFSADRPPEMGPFWTHVFVYPAQDYAVAQEAYPLVGGIYTDYLDNERLRQLWLLKARIYELWPRRAKAAEKRRRPSTEDYKARGYRAALKIYETGQPNLEEAWNQLREPVPGIPRKIGRDDVLKMEEFEQRRRKPGNNRPPRPAPPTTPPNPGTLRWYWSVYISASANRALQTRRGFSAPA